MVNRRQFIKKSAFAAAASLGIASPALSAPPTLSSRPKLKWRLTSSFPKTLDTIFEASHTFARTIFEATDGAFEIRVFPPNEIVPGLQAADAVTNGSVEIAHTAAYYSVGKDPTFALATSIPFGLNARQTNAWLLFGEGQEKMNAFFKKYGIYSLIGGSTGCQMGGWFTREIHNVNDLKGLKMRIAGLGGMVLQRLGASPQQISGGEVYQALEKGTIDAAEWVGPYDDEKLGFYKVAPYYYYPGWWEGGATLHFFINREKWEMLPRSYQTIVEAAAMRANSEMLAKYDAQNPQALKSLIAQGVKLRPFSQEILDACYQASQEMYAEISQKNQTFKEIYAEYAAFADNQYLWQQVAEYTFDNYQIRVRQKAQKK